MSDSLNHVKLLDLAKSKGHSASDCGSPSNALSDNRLIASLFDGFGSGCASIQAWSLTSRGAAMRTPVSGVRAVGGGPSVFFVARLLTRSSREAPNDARSE